ncbi:MAG TPA: hypothetical protein PKK15_11960 [Kouleothrix sp.]|nr:hypothetical protein [Kouleothrix sp.]
MPLPELLAELKRQATQSGQDRSCALSHGARVAWRVRSGEVVFSVARPKVRLGDSELIVFKAAAQVPAEAERIPVEGQQELRTDDGTTWHRVAWKYRQGETP